MGLIETFPSGLISVASLTTTATNLMIPRWCTAVKVYTSVLAKVAFSNDHDAPSTTVSNHIQTITTRGTPTGGTFTLLGPFSGVATSALTYDESAADVKTALVALTDFATGDITAAGGALPTGITLEFTGAYAGLLLPILNVGTNSLTGGTSPEVLIATSQQPVCPYGFQEAGTQETYPVRPGSIANGGKRFVHLAADSASGIARVTWLRG